MCERNLISIREQRNLHSLYFCIPVEVNSSCVRGVAGRPIRRPAQVQIPEGGGFALPGGETIIFLDHTSVERTNLAPPNVWE
jgi:hypothetical protein